MNEQPHIDQASLLPVGTLMKDGKYRIDRYLSSGNFGNTYIVTDMVFNEQLAMKEFYLRGYCYRTNMRQVTMSPAIEPERVNQQREKFKKEALRMRELKGEHVVHIYDLFEENGTTYYIMDYVRGESLASYMEHTGKPLTEEQTLYILDQLLEGLEEVHQKQIWHLDLKPDNIMIDRDGKVVIIDFGASKQLGSSGKYTGTTGVLCYTPGFAPFEQMNQDMASIGPWTDIYALGATLYNLLTNITPAMQTPESLKYPTPVSKNTRDLIAWMMNMERTKRPQSVAAIRAFIDRKAQQQAAASNVSQATSSYVEEEEEEEDNSQRKWLIGGLVGGAIVLFGLFLLLTNGNKGNDEVEDLAIAVNEKAEEAAHQEANNNKAFEAEAAEMKAAQRVEEKQDEAKAKEEDLKKKEVALEKEKKKKEAKERERQAELERIAELERQAKQEQIEQEKRAEEIKEEEDSKIYAVVEQMPSFPGGDAALINYLSQNIRYPVMAEENGIQGRVIVTFVVERDGSITDARVVKSVDPALDKEAVRVIQSMPKWIPGKQNGKAIRVKYTLPVTFRLQ